MVEREFFGLNTRELISAHRDIRRSISVETKLWFSFFINSDERQHRFCTFLAKDVRYTERFAFEKSDQRIAKLIRSDLPQKRNRNTEPLHTDGDIEWRTSSPFMKAGAPTEARTDISREKIEQRFTANQYRGNHQNRVATARHSRNTNADIAGIADIGGIGGAADTLLSRRTLDS
jgi:hypothetical protein